MRSVARQGGTIYSWNLTDNAIILNINLIYYNLPKYFFSFMLTVIYVDNKYIKIKRNTMNIICFTEKVKIFIFMLCRLIPLCENISDNFYIFYINLNRNEKSRNLHRL